MEFGIIIKLLIPIALIGVGIWLKSIGKDKPKKIEKYWYIFILIGIFQLVFRVIKYM